MQELPFFACAEFLPRLFLKDDYQQLVDLAVLNPRWLMSMVKVIVELCTKNSEAKLNRTQLRDLERDGVADFKVFEECWKKYLPAPTSGVGIRHFCLIFQAYCLICPVESIESNCCEPSSEKNPCKLPDIPDSTWISKMDDCTTFYFDFYQFLPNEIYHRLICLASAQAKPDKKVPNCYSKRISFFGGLRRGNWVMEIEEVEQRLKFKVS